MTDWPVKTLGEVCEVVNGATPDTKVKEYWGGSHAWITPAEMGNLDSPFLSMSRRTLSDEGLSSCSASLVPPKTVILSSRAPIGHLVINEVPMATNQGCKSLVPREGLDFNFLYYYLKMNVELLDSLGTGTTFKELSGTQLKTVEIPVPPLEEQKRIVALLDAATARVTELTACYEQARTHANNLFTSALRDALESNPDWPVKTLGDVFRVCSSKRVLKSEWQQEGVPFYRGREITALSRDGRVDNALFISEEHFDGLVQNYGVPKCDDIMITAIGTIGNSYLVKKSDRFYFKDASVLWLDKKSEIHSGYVQHWITSASFKEQLNSGNGATVDTLTIDGLSKMQIPLPSMEEQKRIVARLDAMRAKTSEMVAAYDAKLTAAKNLRQSILEAAFAGEL
jgi:type I restriction enzyme S subunit